MSHNAFVRIRLEEERLSVGKEKLRKYILVILTGNQAAYSRE